MDNIMVNSLIKINGIQYDFNKMLEMCPWGESYYNYSLKIENDECLILSKSFEKWFPHPNSEKIVEEYKKWCFNKEMKKILEEK